MVLNWENHTFPWKKTMTIVIRVLLLPGLLLYHSLLVML
jgi:hypothetical protein